MNYGAFFKISNEKYFAYTSFRHTEQQFNQIKDFIKVNPK
jgi:hypothetical protein